MASTVKLDKAYEEALAWASGKLSMSDDIRDCDTPLSIRAQAIAIVDGMEAIKQYIAYKLLQEGPPSESGE